jgi:hypothetical protein
MRFKRSNERRGVILMVVLAMLTLFAIVGISFVLYAQSEATSARVARDTETAQRADMDPEQCLALFLSQLIYDVNDDMSGVGSALRGHSFARTMYGYSYPILDTPGINVVPYNGVGRLHYPGPFHNSDNYNLVNYTWFSTDPILGGAVRDPERIGRRASPVAPANPNSYVGGNAPYTYPDLNNMFLAAVTSNGTLLAPSFHRPYTGFGTLDPSNPNWYTPSSTNPALKYMVLRPRPVDHAGFPATEDAGGDVKNLVWAPGGIDPITKKPFQNDSIWIDVGAPVMTAPDGTKYKMLVAPLIMDLDNRINVAACGNIAGNGSSSRSNQGWFASEVNLGWLWSNSANTTDWQKLFLGNGAIFGKYGRDSVPSGPLFPGGSPAHVYAPTDLDGRNELANGIPTGPIQLQTTSAATNPNPCFPNFPQGYGSGSAAERIYINNSGQIIYRHPAAYAAYKSPLYTTTTINSVYPPGSKPAVNPIPNDDLVFRPSDMEALLRPNSLGQYPVDTGSSALISNLLRLCPNTLGGTGVNAPIRRNWITTISNDLAKPGLSPWVYNPLVPSPYTVNALTPTLPPTGGAIPFPALTQRTQALPVGTDFTGNWRAKDATQVLGSALGRIDLNRPLPPFPHMASGSTPAIVGPNQRYDNNAAALAASNLATLARQQFAIDIYVRLLAVTGVAPPSNLKTPTAADLAPRRWLAQLAANIVDYIDADEISTPFNFYNPNNGPYGLPVPNNYNYQLTPTLTTIPAAPAGNADVPTYWVYGTELPRVVINEVLGEYTLPTNNLSPPTAVTGPFTVKLWVELFNPMPTGATVTATATANQTTLQPQDALPVPLYHVGNGTTIPSYNPYQVVIANNNIVVNSHGLWYNVADLNANILGTPQQLRYVNAAAATPLPAGCNFASGGGKVWTVAAPPPLLPSYPITPPGGLPGQSFMIVGPQANDVHNDITVAAGVPGTTPLLISPSMQYAVTYHAKLKQWQINGIPVGDNLNGVSVLLRRLANPHLPPNPYTAAGAPTNPALPPNPYVTVDYLHGIPLNGYGMNKTPLPVPVSTFSNLINPIPPNNSPVPPASFGKRQPYAANSTQCALQTTPRTGTILAPPRTRHTLGLPNLGLATLPPTLDNPFTWLVHLDRKLISPMELLHVSGFPSHDLTQRFIMVPNAAAGNPPIPQPYSYTQAGGVPNSAYFQHYVPWFDQTRRLYRLFELLEARDAASGISPVNGRVPGKININTLYDLPTVNPIYQAIADPSPTPDNPNFNAASVNASFAKLLAYRTPNLGTTGLSAGDRPLVGMAAGFTATGDTQYPLGNGINHTLLTSGQAGIPPTTPGTGAALQLPNTTPANPQTAHPYLQNQLLTKVYNNFTTRSNTFAVFVTVGFFQVVNPNTSPPQLGPEIGRSEGRQVRHRMFAIVDRTNLSVFSTTSSTAVSGPTATNPTGTATIQVGAWAGTNPNTGATWSIQPGTQLVIEPGTANEETVTVTAVNGAASPPTITANFTLPHPNTAVTGTPLGSPYAISQRGNPGPWKRYDPRQDPAVVPYYSIID